MIMAGPTTASRAAPAGEVYAESGAIVIGEGDRRYHCRQVIPDAAVSVDQMLGFRFFTREEPMGVEHQTGAFQHVWHMMACFDVRFSARTCRMRIEALADGPFALGRSRLDLKAGGSR